MSKTFLAFDLGASSGRGILGTIDNGNISLEEIHRFPNGPKEIDGSLFWDFDSLWNEIKAGLKKATEKCDNISGVAIDTWGVDYVLMKEDGSFTRLPYQYRDSRTDGIPEEIFENMIPQKELYAKAGIQSMFFNTIYQLVAHHKQHPEDFENTKLLFMPDALTYLLSGEATCEYTIASTSGLLNAEKRDWDFEVIEKLGLPKEIFPEIVQPCTKIGTVKEELKKELGIECGDIPVLRIGSHDTASAVAAIPADPSTKWAYLSCGTWALLGIESDKPVTTEEAMTANFTNEGGLNNTIRLLTNINGTWILQETRRVWNEAGRDLSFMDIEEMAKNSEGGKFRIDPNDPIFAPPGDMPERVKEYCEKTGQPVPSTDEEVVRCIYESLALCFKDKLKLIEELTGTPIEVLHVVGGGVYDKTLMQMTSDFAGIPVITKPVEATAVGNIMAQAITTGDITDLNEGRQIVKNSFDVEKYTPK